MKPNIQTITKQILSGVTPEKIILFGSHAWGSPSPGSDVDLLVILSTPLSRRERRRQISDLLRPRSVPLDIFVYTPEEVGRAVKVQGSFIKEILQRGKVLYEKE